MLKKGYGITKGGAEVFTGAGYAFVSQRVRGGTDPLLLLGRHPVVRWSGDLSPFTVR